LGKVRRNRRLDLGDGQKKRQMILAALAGAVEDMQATETDTPKRDGDGEYYTLTHEEIEALVNGDVETIRKWAGTLDRHHAAGLLNWLIEEGW
jgi:hypothetical protein